MDDKEWAAGIEMALNAALGNGADYLPGVWVALQNLAKHLPVCVSIAQAGPNYECDDNGACKQVAVSVKARS